MDKLDIIKMSFSNWIEGYYIYIDLDVDVDIYI